MPSGHAAMRGSLTGAQRLVWLVLSALPVLLFVWNSLFFTPWMVDDAFISLRYARNLVDGHGLVYNPGERVEGFSNFSWVLLAAGLMAARIPVVTALKAIGLIAGVATLLLSAGLTRRLAGPEGGRRCGAATLWYLGCNSSLALWCQSGLETSVFAVLIVAMCLRYEREVESNRRRPWSALLFAMAWMTRPETPVYGLYFLARRASIPRRPDRRDGWWLAALAAHVVPYEIWGRAYYGSWLPQTHAAKIGPWTWENLRDVQSYLTGQGWGFAGLLVLALAGTALRGRHLPPAVWAPILSGLIFVAYAGPDWMPGYRLFVPFLAMQAGFVALGIANLLRATRNGRILLAAAAGATLVAGADYARGQMTGSSLLGGGKPRPEIARTASWWREVPGNLRRREWPLEMAALSILAHAEPGARIVTKDIGFPGFLTMNPVWDQAGLITPEAAELRHRGDDPEVRARFVRRFLEAGGATHIFIPPVPWPHVALLEDLLRTHPDLQAMYRALEADRPGGSPLKRFERIVLCLPPGASRVWRLQELPSPTPGQVLANLERRLPEVVARFPEYGPRAADVLSGLRRYVQGSTGRIGESEVAGAD